MNGQFMFYCDLRRAKWYLKKNLACIVVQTPDRFEIQLTFESRGTGQNDEFSSHEIIQRCVVCSTVNDLTKHHIVPSCYRKFFSKEYKAKINHDVVIVCENHHHIYEDYANVLKDNLAAKFDVPTLQQCSELQCQSSNPLLKNYNTIRSLLKTYFEQINDNDVSPKLIEKIKIVGIDINQDLKKILNDTEEQIKTIMNLSSNVEHGQLVVSKIDNIDSFIRMWRKHFIGTMNPQYMPHGWSVTYKTKITN